jgi:hypothetical protein
MVTLKIILLQYRYFLIILIFKWLIVLIRLVLLYKNIFTVNQKQGSFYFKVEQLETFNVSSRARF